MAFQQLMCYKLLTKTKNFYETYPLMKCQNVSLLKRCYQVDPDRAYIYIYSVYSRLIVRCSLLL